MSENLPEKEPTEKERAFVEAQKTARHLEKLLASEEFIWFMTEVDKKAKDAEAIFKACPDADVVRNRYVWKALQGVSDMPQDLSKWVQETLSSNNIAKTPKLS